MAKKRVKDELQIKEEELDEDTVTDEEKAVLDEGSEDEGKPETGGEGDEDKGGESEEKPGEGAGDEEGGEKKGDEEDEVKGEGEGDKPGEGEEEKGTKPPAEGAGQDDPLQDAKPVTLEIDGEKVRGWLAKSGKYIIDYSDVEKRDTARRTLKATVEVQDGQIKALKGQVEQLNERLKSDQGDVAPEGETATDQLDFKALGAQLYKSEDDAAVVLEKVFNAGRRAERAGAGEGGAPEGETRDGESQVLTPEQEKAQIEMKVALQAGIEKVVEQHPILKDPDVEFVAFQLGMKLIGEKIQDMDEPSQAAWVQNPENLLGVIEEAAKKTVALTSGSEESDEQKAAREKEQEEVLFNRVVKRLNLTPEDVRTLGDVAGTGGSPANPFKELDDLEGEALEEAIEKLPPKEREAYLNST